MKILGYAWRVLVNLFYVAIVLYVFDRLKGRHDTIVLVAILGLIYVTIRSIAIGQALGLVVIVRWLAKDLMRIRQLLRDHLVEKIKPEFNDQVKQADREAAKL